jgi:hypothetical protein
VGGCQWRGGGGLVLRDGQATYAGRIPEQVSG